MVEKKYSEKPGTDKEHWAAAATNAIFIFTKSSRENAVLSIKQHKKGTHRVPFFIFSEYSRL